MSQIFYEKRCRCKEEFLITKKRKSSNRSEGKPLQYPSSNEILSKTFKIKYENELSSRAKLILNSLKNKYLYYAIDDILFLFKLKPIEGENLLNILYSTVLSIHNNLSINFFDIWIQDIYISQGIKTNKFLANTFKYSEPVNYITIKLFYKPKVLIKKQNSLW